MTDSDGRVFASIGPAGIVHYTKCWDCQTMQCPGGIHGWADIDDVKHAAATGQPDPSGQRCGCDCFNGPILQPQPDEPEWDELESLDAVPCDVCGELRACGYDAEGRSMIHAFSDDEDGDS